MISEKVRGSLVNYALYHQDKRNEVVHLIGIPLIIIGLGIVLAELSFFIPLAVYLAYCALCRANWASLALGILISVAIFLAFFVPWWVGAIAVAVSLISQVISHRLFEKGEGKNPAFLTNLKLALVAPIWWACHISKSQTRI